MRTTITFGLCITLIAVLTSIASAQQVGCCCDPITKGGSFTTQNNCPSSYPFGLPQNPQQTCAQYCGTLSYQPSQPTCGNNQCETGETAVNCPQDCAIISGCGSPNYAPAPTLTIQPVKAQKALTLTYIAACTPEFISIYRCKGNQCTPTELITQELPSGQFIDNDPELEFNTDYTYAISANYQISGVSPNTTQIGNIGDLECHEQSSSTFCISSTYYDRYKQYLETFGFAAQSGNAFKTQFLPTVSSAFGNKFNKAYQCSSQNKLSSEVVSCSLGAYCVADEQGASCVTPSACDEGNPFGLYSSVSTCETNAYCFYDKSFGPTNKCYNCKPQMTCADYKTLGACQRDNCNAGNCQWNPTFPELGIGVCVNQDTSNCIFCVKKGTDGADTFEVTSSIWDACTEQKSEALSTQNFPCFYDRNLREAKTCQQVTCADYTEIQCGSPQSGIQLGADNTVITTSSDTCGIGVCQYSPTAGCVKNADASTGEFKDCAFGDSECEQDYFPPQTTIIPTGVAGRVDKLLIKLFDQQNSSGASKDFAGQNGFITYVCIANATNSCDNAKNFPIQVNAKELIVSNGQLKIGQTNIATLPSGTTTIHYYSKDNHNNLEIVKTATFFACTNCNGPQILNITITNGALLNTTLYTSSTSPEITIIFDAPTEITFLQLQGLGNPIITQQTSGMRLNHTFTVPTITLGNYILGFNARNDKNIYFAPPGPTYTLLVDNTAPTAIILPSNVILNTSQIDVNITFSKPTQLETAELITERYTDFAIQENSRNILGILQPNADKTIYKARITNLSGGTNIISINARGYNGLLLSANSQFYISTRAPDMRMTIPSFGSANASQFGVEIETELLAECAYIYNTPTAPNASDFDIFPKFNDQGNKHTASGFEIPFGVQSAQLHAYCRTNQFGTTQKTFKITLDTEPPIIERVIAEPPIIAERYYADQDLFITTLRVELDKEGFCKYSTITAQFTQMNNTFPGYDLVPKKTHSVQINVTEERTYRYYISCKGTNQLISEPSTFDVTVNLDLPLNITSITPRGFNSTNVTIGIAASKRVFCYFGTQEDDQSTCMGSCTADYVNWQPIQTGGEGEYNYFVSCVQPTTQERIGPIRIPVKVDTTPPTMNFVSDDSVLEDPELSFSKTKLRAAFQANDQESGISHYLITIQDRNNRQIIVNNLVSNVTDGNYTYIQQRNDGGPLNLVNGRTYIFKAKAVNNVGLISEEMESDGVTIDVSLEPEACLNTEKGGNETDIDCGGECQACVIGKTCNIDSDCETNYCANGICDLAVCDDLARNGFETDIDCGGETCASCALGKECITHTDCQNGYCSPDTKTCEDASHCTNGQLDFGETDIDCGKACPTLCAAKQACKISEDCEGGLSCDIQFNICTDKPIGDEDLDGVNDPFDACAGTPPTETADEKGCSPSQTYTLGDSINDQWRLDYFGCIDCPEASEQNDYDKDTLTNKQEYNLRTNPTKKDTDSDGWNDNIEIEKGTDPLNPKSHPPSIIGIIFMTLLIILALSAAGIGGYLLYQRMMQKQKEEQKAPLFEKIQTQPYTKTFELKELRTFAKKEDIEEKDWILLQEKIKKQALTPQKFEQAMQKLKTLAAKKEHAKEPLSRLIQMLEEMSTKDRTELLEQLKLLHAGALTKKEQEELFRKLKITAEYYDLHKKQFQEEIKKYGHAKH